MGRVGKKIIRRWLIRVTCTRATARFRHRVRLAASVFAVIGGIIGHQVGEGNGNTAATVIGAAGGALIGHEIEKQNQPQGDQFRLTIRMENGGYQTVIQNTDFVDLRIGDRLHIDDGGTVRRY